MSNSARYFKQPEVIQYDPSIRDYPVLSNGNTGIMHPVDQRVALCLNILQGTLAGDSLLGNKLREIKRLGSQQAIADAKRCVVSALQDIIDDGEITLLDITVVFPNPGRMDIFVSYRNNILSKALQPKTASITIGGN